MGASITSQYRGQQVADENNSTLSGANECNTNKQDERPKILYQYEKDSNIKQAFQSQAPENSSMNTGKQNLITNNLVKISKKSDNKTQSEIMK